MTTVVKVLSSGMKFEDYLTQVIAAEDQIISNKSRVISTVNYVDKILGACLDASTGDTERKIFGDLKTIADKLLTILT